VKLKTFLFASILAVVVFMTPALFAQTTHPTIPQGEVVAKAKPFLGNFQSVVCDPKAPSPYGIKFNIRLDTVKDDEGKDIVQPVFKILGISTGDLEPFDFRTVDFTEIVGDTPDKHFIWIDVTNGGVVLNLQPALPNARKDFVVALNGDVETVYGGEYQLFAQRQEEPTNIKDYNYLKTLSQACPVSEKQDPGQNIL
jgi:hypothetical protein